MDENMYDKINSGYYENPLEYPTKPKRPFIGNKPSAVEASKYIDKISKYEQDLLVYKSKLENYTAKQKEIYIRFQRDALYDVGLTDHPKQEKAWSFAWEHGHSSGYFSIYDWLCEISDLIL